MSHEEPIIEQTADPGTPEHATAIHGAAAQDTVPEQPSPLAHGPAEPAYAGEEQEWLEESDAEELPRRPRRRLLSSPLPLALLGVLLIACGFIGGVLVEKGQTSSSSTTGGAAASLASRFAALRGGASGGGAAGGASGTGAGATSGASSAGSSAAGGGFFARSGGSAGAGATTGQVAYIAGSTLYVTIAEGNTVKVTTAPGATVTKTVKADVKGIHPGETVLVTGTTGANGAISAGSIRVGGGAGGGLGALLGGATGGGRRSSSGGGAPASGGGAGGEPALFGKGG